MGIAELINLEKEDRLTYEEGLKKHRDLKNVMDTRYNQGVNAGMELGKQEGIELGKQVTISETVICMYKAGIEISIICQVTNLEVNEVNQVLERAGLV